jgi:hypothetical protein
MKLDINLRALSFVLAISALPGCLANGEEAPETNSFDAISDVDLAGPVVQGVILNGLQTNGHNIAGISFHAAIVAGKPAKLSLRAGDLMAAQAGGDLLGGEKLEGAVLKGSMTDQTPVSLRIDDVAGTADPEIFEYTIAAWNGSTWTNACGERDGMPVPALALAGRWDESSGTPTGGDHIDETNVFTFACKTAVTAKCVGMGYAPWRSITECHGNDCQTIAMRDMHQACTRMMRADYCGDGTAHTQNGTLINAWDNFDIQTQDTAVPVTWTNEAEWTPNGAACIQQVRWSGTAEAYIANHCPERWVSDSFDCFTSQSTFFTNEGFATLAADRSLLRNQFTHDAP